MLRVVFSILKWKVILATSLINLDQFFGGLRVGRS